MNNKLIKWRLTYAEFSERITDTQCILHGI